MATTVIISARSTEDCCTGKKVGTFKDLKCLFFVLKYQIFSSIMYIDKLLASPVYNFILHGNTGFEQ